MAEVGTMEDLRYASAVARIRVLEKSLLSGEKIRRMEDAPDVPGAWQETKGWGLKETGDINAGDAGEINAFLLSELRYTRDLVLSLALEKNIAELFFIKYDLQNIRAALKGMGDEGISDIGTVPARKIKSAMESSDFTGLRPMLRKIMSARIEELRAEPENAGAVLDADAYRLSMEEINGTEFPSREFVREVFRTEIDIHNLRSLARSRRLSRKADFFSRIALDGGTLEKKFLVDRYESETGGLDSMVSSRLQESSARLKKLYESSMYTAFGFEPVITYLKMRERDARLIRGIMLSKIYGEQLDTADYMV
ncbi:hypothetical protein COY52_02715 [Candidatus Desantisbacteria bacterium CG_4_10_14_0_8_um_filter_48_22]|uniref:V-type ATP synthase subunit C n=1 Tax=Candidatus Desantisbacteria bacterium CG_4_10_14_0_8_um_filter_48_22 TaxID=1974543 RepID=A0A2M7SEA4_9BACT|nr:MAG: hypothetical protein AUJ67_07470 [Candidatus Desantisbacteria bacterium CG1_02_49_89]PIV55546.1 MAG: hypothetical protein COS16_06835 [Candidatus Desantisbacteria bacterium CG02_land_8_20_14_3_00_49_13]PIZ17814.1 MAG: hypothetical protein COY52_02715 [Candidatus Desantisbacteria bacterium CG_4_10_14_0_8_um_filter_48_22]